MGEHMFRDVVDPGAKIGGRRKFSVPFSIAAHTVVLAVAVIVPLMASDALPPPSAIVAFIAAPPLPAPPPPPPPSQAHQSRQPEPAQSNAAPLDAPSAIVPERAFEPASENVGIVEGIPSIDCCDSNAPAAVVPPRLVVEPDIPTAPVRLDAGVKPPTKVKDVRPVYPPVALASRVQGIVIIEATIGPTGKVENARALKSHPLLEQAALEAVRQWEFTPTLLHGTPISVLMTVTVNFSLQP